MGSRDQIRDLLSQRLFVALETLDHGGEEVFRFQPLKRERMSGTGRQKRKESCLRPPVSLLKRVDGIERRKKVRGRRCEPFRRLAIKMPPPLEIGKQAAHLLRDIFWIAEGASMLENADRSELSRPGVDILKKVTMDRAIVGHAQPAKGQRLIGSLRGHCPFECV
ncbi:MAG TPA: hypothetical protein VHU18_13465 [Rhizomicrobium sp.]|nr:hypothetical protein [Rhizomicrobium sp.]